MVRGKLAQGAPAQGLPGEAQLVAAQRACRSPGYAWLAAGLAAVGVYMQHQHGLHAISAAHTQPGSRGSGRAVRAWCIDPCTCAYGHSTQEAQHGSPHHVSGPVVVGLVGLVLDVDDVSAQLQRRGRHTQRSAPAHLNCSLPLLAQAPHRLDTLLWLLHETASQPLCISGQLCRSAWCAALIVHCDDSGAGSSAR